MKKTIFYDTHVRLGAKMSPFGGFDMPIHYEGIIAEHLQTRTGATLFDTCHMGEFLIEGEEACADLDAIVSCDIHSLRPGKCKYGFICNQSGGVIDDQLTYRLSPASFFMVVNASTAEGDFSWLRQHCGSSTKLTDVSEETAKIDLQGPGSVKIAKQLFGDAVTGLPYYGCMYARYKGAPFLISRTGYTGELGFEIYLDASRALECWNECMSLGAKPAGLGARDTLRLEMGFPLYGHELDINTNAAESGFTAAISCGKKFIGSQAVCAGGAPRRMLAGVQLSGRRAARAGDTIFNAHGHAIGAVSSGSFAPSLGFAVAMGYVDGAARQPLEPVTVGNDRYRLDGVITRTPFYSHATARKKTTDFI